MAKRAGKRKRKRIIRRSGGARRPRRKKGPDGKYHIGGGTYDLLKGSRRQVWNGTAYETKGGCLKKSDLKYNPKTHRIISKKASNKAKKRYQNNPKLRKILKEHQFKKGSKRIGGRKRRRRKGVRA